ncbi:MAG: DNRLRE domain-containing protein [Opitutaceae bacterium]|nr:DNRLRE domain-containing protein [Opitutaceae bacterium]
MLSAESLTITTFADAGIRQAAPTTVYASGNQLYVGTIDGTKPSASRALVAFDLSAVPANATITSASVKLFAMVNDGSSVLTDPITTVTLDLHALNSSFGETGATWNSSSSGSNWTTAGGDFDATVLASAQLPTRGTVPAGGRISLLESASLLTLIQQKHAAGSIVYLLLKADSAGETASERQTVMLSTREDTTDGASGAQLIISYSTSQIPEASTSALGLGLGGAIVAAAHAATRIRRSPPPPSGAQKRLH